METKRVKIRINTIRRAADQANGMPGNLLINSKQGEPNWFPNREFRNLLIGAGLTGEEPPFGFVGATMTYDRVTVDQKDIDEAIKAGKEGVEVLAQGRTITYKKPGVHNINLELDWSTVNITDSTLALAKLSKLYTRRTAANTPTRPMITPGTQDETLEEEINEPLPDEHKMPKELDGVKSDAAGIYTNADDSALSKEQEELLNKWVAETAAP